MNSVFSRVIVLRGLPGLFPLAEKVVSCSSTSRIRLLELSADQKYLGAVPGIIQVLHTWDQEMLYHVHMHCIISGGGLTQDHKIRKTNSWGVVNTTWK